MRACLNALWIKAKKIRDNAGENRTHTSEQDHADYRFQSKPIASDIHRARMHDRIPRKFMTIQKRPANMASLL